jgi:hypothetical protein
MLQEEEDSQDIVCAGSCLGSLCQMAFRWVITVLIVPPLCSGPGLSTLFGTGAEEGSRALVAFLDETKACH